MTCEIVRLKVQGRVSVLESTWRKRQKKKREELTFSRGLADCSTQEVWQHVEPS